MSASTGNVVEIAKFATHCAAAATASALARMRLGNISPSSTQTTGPHDAPKNTTNALAAMSATVAQAPSSEAVDVPSEAVVIVACVNATAIMPSETNMPVD